jgi:hypothetical protein
MLPPIHKTILMGHLLADDNRRYQTSSDVANFNTITLQNEVRKRHLPGKCVGVGDSPANWRLVRPRFETESPVRPDP